MKLRKGKNQVDLKSIFLGVQKQMIARLSTAREGIGHPGTKGKVSELNWIQMLNDYLPARYKTSQAFIVDSRGNCSHQIDVVLYDRQYCPFLLKESDAVYVPAESVYAVFEVKPKLSKAAIEYAGSKAESVRRLHRTSIPIPHAGGAYPPKKPFRIIGGLLCLDSSWSEAFGVRFISSVRLLNSQQRLDLGCVLQRGAFEVEYAKNGLPSVRGSGKNEALIIFFLRLLSRLQELATVPAIDIDEYRKAF